MKYLQGAQTASFSCERLYYAKNDYKFKTENKNDLHTFHIRTVQHLDITKVLFIHQPMHQWVVPKNNIKIYIKTAPTCFGVTVKPSSGSALIRAY